MAMTTVRVKVKSPIFYYGKMYKVGSELDIESNIYQKHKELFEVIQFKKIETKKNEVKDE